MSFVQRVKRRAMQIKRLRPERIAPTATVRGEVEAGDWSQGPAERRLASVCRAASRALRAEPVFAGSFDGDRDLRFGGPPVLWVGPAGGRAWLRIEGADLAGERIEGLLSGTSSSPDELPPEEGLEVLDLSDLGIDDWRGTIVSPRVARLVLLSEYPRPAVEGGATRSVFPVAIDFDLKVADAALAAGFLDALRAGLGESGD